MTRVCSIRLQMSSIEYGESNLILSAIVFRKLVGMTFNIEADDEQIFDPGTRKILCAKNFRRFRDSFVQKLSRPAKVKVEGVTKQEQFLSQ